MQQYKIALFVDVDNVKMKKDSLEELVFKLQKIGKIVFGRFYNYSDRKNKDLTSIIESYGFTTAMLTEINKKSRHNFLDLRIAIDATKLDIRNQSIDAFCFYTGQAKGDISPLVSSLKADGKYVIEAISLNAMSASSLFDDQIMIYKSLEVKPPVPRAAKPRKVQTAKVNIVNQNKSEANSELNGTNENLQSGRKIDTAGIASIKSNQEKATYNNRVLSKEQILAMAKSQIEEETKRLRESEKDKIEEELKNYREQELAKLEAQKKEIEENVKQQLAEKQKYEEENAKYEATKEISDKRKKVQQDFVENFKEAKTLNEKLEDFAERTNNLNFDYNKDIDAKLQLLYDIEECLAEEALEGRGKNSDNKEERDAFNEIQELIVSLKETILGSMDKELVNEQNYTELHKEEGSRSKIQNTDNQSAKEPYLFENPIQTASDEDYDF